MLWRSFREHNYFYLLEKTNKKGFRKNRSEKERAF